jgi:glycine dehydrogenase
MTQTLSQLENRGAFIERHIGPDAQQQQEMLKTVGADSLNALIGQIVPQDIQLATPPQVGDATTEFAALAELKAIAGRNKRFKSYIGMGYTAVQLPPVIQRNMLENRAGIPLYPLPAGSFQGRLESLLNFQQVTLDLTGLDIASASLLDEATAAAEAMAMAKRVSKLKNANRFFVAADHPQTLDVVRTRAETFGFDVIVDDAEKARSSGRLRRAAAAGGHHRRSS